jgi:hypothetical protein
MAPDQGLCVEVLGSYSNPSVVSRLQTILAGQNDNRVSDRSPVVSRKRPKKTQIRLSDDEIDVVAAAYQDGLNLNELTSAFGADRRTLANRLEHRGITRRNRRLSDDQIAEAIELYNSGWSLAKIATQFQRLPHDHQLVAAKARRDTARTQWMEVLSQGTHGRPLSPSWPFQ